MLHRSVTTFLKLWLSCLLAQPALLAVAVLLFGWQSLQNQGHEGTLGLGTQLAVGATFMLLSLALVGVSVLTLSRTWLGRWRFWKKASSQRA